MTDLSFFLPNLNGGGAERVILNLAIGFAHQGLAVDLVLAKAKGEYLPQVPPQVNLVDLNAQRLIASVPALVRYLRRRRPPVLIAALEEANVVAIACQKLAGVPTQVMITAHNHLSIQLQHSGALKRRLTPMLLRLAYPFAHSIVSVSEGVAIDLARMTGLPHRKIQVIYNPIVTPTLLAKIQEPVQHPWLMPHQQSHQEPVILGVGRLSQQKDFQTLIRAVAQVRQQRPVRLIILGEGEERPQLEELIAQLGLTDVVDLPGFIPNPYPAMARAAVFVMSSAWEGFGNVLVEAMAAGTPIISTHCPSGPSEILDHGRYGQLIPVGDVQRLAKAILTTLDCPPDAQVLQQRSQDFSLAHILPQYGRMAHLPTPLVFLNEEALTL